MTTKTATAAIALTKRFCFTFRLFLSLRVLLHSLVFPLHINLDFHARAGIPRSHLHKQHIPILLNKTHSMSFVSVINFFLLLVLPGGVSHTLFYCLPPAATPESHKEEATTQKKNPRGHARKHQSTTDGRKYAKQQRTTLTEFPPMLPSPSRVDIKYASPRNQNYTQASSQDKCLIQSVCMQQEQSAMSWLATGPDCCCCLCRYCYCYYYYFC